MKQSIFQQAAAAATTVTPEPILAEPSPANNPLLNTLPQAQSHVTQPKEGDVQETATLNSQAALTPQLPDTLTGASLLTPQSKQQQASPFGDGMSTQPLQPTDVPSPPPPPTDAGPEEVMRFLCAKMKHAVDTHTHGKEVLAEVHQFLVAQPALKELLLPEDMASITSLMQRITTTAHKTMTAAKATATVKAAEKDERKEAAAAMLSGITI